MAKRSSYWVIVSGQQPTSFRAREREDLVPTLTQLLRTQPDTKLMYFDQGKLWETSEAADEAFAASRGLRRGRDWRPDERPRDERPRDERPRDEQPSDDRPKDDRPKDDRPRDDRSRDDRP